MLNKIDIQIRFGLLHNCLYWNAPYDVYDLYKHHKKQYTNYVAILTKTLKKLKRFYDKLHTVRIWLFAPTFEGDFDGINFIQCDTELDAYKLYKHYTYDDPFVYEVGCDFDDFVDIRSLVNYKLSLESNISYISFFFDKIYLKLKSKVYQLNPRVRNRISYIILTDKSSRGFGLKYFHTYHLRYAKTFIPNTKYLIYRTTKSVYTNFLC